MPSRNTLGYAAILALAIASVLALDLVIFPLFVSPAGPSVPPPSKSVVDYGCVVSNPPPSQDSLQTLVSVSGGTNESIEVSFNPTLPLSGSTCSYFYSYTDTPTACGTMCGGGVGHIISYSNVWTVNFTISSAVAAQGRNLTVSGGTEGLFPQPGFEVYINSQPTTTWSRAGMSLIIAIPNAVEDTSLQLTVNSTETLVP